jgi:hypothetical protein
MGNVRYANLLVCCSELVFTSEKHVTLEGNRNGGMTQLSDPFVNNIWSHGKNNIMMWWQVGSR